VTVPTRCIGYRWRARSWPATSRPRGYGRESMCPRERPPRSASSPRFWRQQRPTPKGPDYARLAPNARLATSNSAFLASRVRYARTLRWDCFRQVQARRPILVGRVDVNDPFQAGLLQQACGDSGAIADAAMHRDGRVARNLGCMMRDVRDVHVHGAGGVTCGTFVIVPRVEDRHDLAAQDPRGQVLDVGGLESR